MLLWNKRYQEVNLVVSSVTTKVKGVAQTRLPEIGDVVWDVADYSGSTQVRAASPGRVLQHSGEPDQHFQHVLSSLPEQKLLLRGDQRHRDKESEAGKVSGGALVFLVFIFQLASVRKLFLFHSFLFQVPAKGRLCRSDKDCEAGAWDHQSHGKQELCCLDCADFTFWFIVSGLVCILGNLLEGLLAPGLNPGRQ